MMINPKHKPVPRLFLSEVPEETAIEQGAQANSKTDEETVEPRGWALKWDGVALLQIRDDRAGLGPSAANRPVEQM